MFKKFIIGCLITSVILTGCSKNTADTTSTAKRLSKAEMLEMLNAYNAAHARPVRPEACKFFGCIGKVLKIAAADITGAASGVVGIAQAAAALGIGTGGTGGVIALGVGGAIAGAGASYKAATTQYTKVQPLEEKFGNITLNIPAGLNGLRNIGFKHNRVIYDVNFGHMEEGLLNQYYQGTLALPSLYVSVINSDIYQDRKLLAENLGRDYVFSNYDFNFLLNEAVDVELITPDMRPVLLAFLQGYANTTTNAEMKSIIDHYISVVDQSALTDLERQALISGFIVASESPFVFYNNVNEEL